MLMTIIRRKLKDSLASYSNDFECTVLNDDFHDCRRILSWDDTGHIQAPVDPLEKQPIHEILHGNRFWLTQTMLLYYVLFRVNSGELRFYVFLACLLGFSMYQGLAARPYKAFLEHIIRMVAAAYRFCKRTVQVLVIIPVKWLFQLITVIAVFILSTLATILRWLVKIIAVPLFWLCGWYIACFLKQFKRNYTKLQDFIVK